METSTKNISNIGEASFSCYLNEDPRENFIHKLTAESSPYPPNAIVLSPDISSTKSMKTATKGDDGEIGVFSAEKYYNMKLDYSTPVIIDTARDNHLGYRSVNQADLPSVKTKSRYGTPSVSSESSWNSQSALLQNHYKRNLSHDSKKLNKISSGRSCFATICCHRSCASKKSVSVRQISDPAKETPCMKKQILAKDVQLQKPVDVFDSKVMDKEDIEMKLEWKLSMLTWDAIPKSSNLPTNSVKSQQLYDHDIESDASSDLFEIDNMIPGSGLSTSDYCPYEPSETSIEWSVVTASAADVSVVSDYDEKKLTGSAISTPANRLTSAQGGKAGKSGRSSGVLLGCKSQKAINVAESTTYKTNDKNRSQRSIAPMPAAAVRKLQVQNML